MPVNTSLAARTDKDVPDSSSIYGPGWHAPLPDVLRPGMSVKIGLKGEHGREWPWATIRRVLNDRLWLRVEHTVYAEEHGVESGSEIEARREHLHMVVEQERNRMYAIVLEQWEIDRLKSLLDTARNHAENIDELYEPVDRCSVLQSTPTPEQLRQWAYVLAQLSDEAKYLSGVFGLTFGSLFRNIKLLPEKAA